MNTQYAGTASRQWLAGAWLGEGSMGQIAEINTQCLDLLCNLAACPDSAGRHPAVIAAHLPLWKELTPTACAQLAASPWLLADAGFSDAVRWQGLGSRKVRDLQRDFAQPAFEGVRVNEFVRSVLVLGWHLARANPQVARVALGLSPVCAPLLAELSLRDLDWIAEHRPGWVRPRWESQPRVWRHLLLAAYEEDPRRLTQAGLRGIQLMAASILPLHPGEL